MSDGFDNPAAMQKLQINFGRLYFSMLNEYAINNTLPASWWIATKSWPASLSLFLAIRAHIVHDAHLAIAQLSRYDAVSEHDYLAVNHVILRSFKSVISVYSVSTTLRLVRETAIKPMVLPACSLIFTMRRSAWRRQNRIEFTPSAKTSNSTVQLNDLTNLNSVRLLVGFEETGLH